MIKLPLFGFFTGLHLALLQFSYFFLLLINITSTYVAYATIVCSWMSGTVIGLLWERLEERLILAVGVLSYYMIYALVMYDPLSPYTFPFAAVGVAITGLWAGRFFIAMQPLFARADQLFFHENNGFLLGVLSVFVGFTLLGQNFLLWTPLLSGTFLFAYLCWLKAVPPTPAPSVTAANGQANAPMAGLIGLTQRLTVNVTTVMTVINVILGLGLFLQGLMTGEDNGMGLESRHDFIIWFATLQLLLISIVAYGNYEIVMLLRRLDHPADEGHGNPWVWLISASVFLFLALNERFKIVQALQGVFQETQSEATLDFLHLGHGELFVYLVIAFPLLGLLLKDLLHQPKNLVLCWFSIVLLVAIMIMSGLVANIVESWPRVHFWVFVFQKIGELWTQLLFLISFFIIFRWRMGQIQEILRD